MSSATAVEPPRQQPAMVKTLAPLAVDILLPFAAYFVTRHELGASLVTALIVSSVVPVLRTLTAMARSGRPNQVALLVLSISVASIALSVVSGSARLIIAKDSAVSGIAAAGILLSALRGRSLMSDGLRPFVCRGDARREAAWSRLASSSAEFARYERRFGIVWGAALLTDALARITGAILLPVSTMSWLSTVIIVAALAFAMIVSGGIASEPITELVDAEVR